MQPTCETCHQDVGGCKCPFGFAETLLPGEVVHMCPPEGSGLMPCCGRTPFEVMSDRMTLDADLVNCEATA